MRRLVDEEVDDTDTAFWSSLFTAPLSVEDTTAASDPIEASLQEIFELISPRAVRSLCERPRNLQAQLCAAIAWLRVGFGAEGLRDFGSSHPGPPSSLAGRMAMKLASQLLDRLSRGLGERDGSPWFGGSSVDKQLNHVKSSLRKLLMWCQAYILGFKSFSRCC